MAQPTSKTPPFASLKPRSVVACAFALALAAGPVAAQDDDDILVPDDAPAAPAKARPKVGLVPLVPVGEATRPLAQQVTEGLTKELSEGFEIVPLTLRSRTASAAAPNQDAAVEARTKAGKYAKAGRQALERLQFGRAEKAFRAAAESYTAAAPVLDDIAPVLAAYVGLAEVYARQGEEEKAKQALAAVSRLDPEFELDEAKYPPLFITTHRTVRAGVMKEEPGAIVVDRTGAGALVVVDGRDVGEAPIKVLGLAAGTHFIRVSKDGAGVFGKAVTVAPGAEATVSPGFTSLDADGPLDALALNRFSDAAAQKVADAAKEQGLKTAVVGAMGKTDTGVPTVLIAVDTATGKASRIGPLEFDGDLLNLSIEALKARDALGGLVQKGGYSGLADDALVPGVKAASSLEVAEVTLRYDVKAAPKAPRGSRVLGKKDEPTDDQVGLGGDGGRSILSAGDKGSRLSMRDDSKDKLGGRRDARKSDFVQEDVPLMEQAWFWPTAIAGGVVGGLLVVGGLAGGLLATDIIPRERTGMQVNVELPE